MKEADQDYGHVVASQSAHVVVSGQTPVHQFFTDYLGLKAVGYPPDNKVGHLLKNSMLENINQQNIKRTIIKKY